MRRQVVELLADGERAAGEIGERFHISQPSVSRHLRVLRESGLVNVRIDAQRRIYSLNPEPLVEIESWASRYRRLWQHRFDRLGEHLQAMSESRERGGGTHDKG